MLIPVFVGAAAPADALPPSLNLQTRPSTLIDFYSLVIGLGSRSKKAIDLGGWVAICARLR